MFYLNNIERRMKQWKGFETTRHPVFTFSGPVFCTQPDYIAEAQDEICIKYISEFLPISLPSDSEFISSHAAEMCNTVFGISC